MVIQSNTLTVTCRATRKDGQPCHAPAHASGYCFSHDPDLQDKRRAAYALGGHNKAKSVRLRRLIPPRLLPVFDRLEGVLEELHDGAIDPRTATAMAAVASVLCRLLTAGEVEERLRNLEERMRQEGYSDAEH